MNIIDTLTLLSLERSFIPLKLGRNTIKAAISIFGLAGLCRRLIESERDARKLAILWLIQCLVFCLLSPILVSASEERIKPLVPKGFDSCASCHGGDFRGTGLAPPLVGNQLKYGDSVEAIKLSISKGYPDKGMPAWSSVLSASDILLLAETIVSAREASGPDELKDGEMNLPDGIVKSEWHDFKVEVVSRGLDSKPYSIAPMPDGRILLTEKFRGLSIISADGTQSALIKGMPEVSDGKVGWMHDVALHPDYETNGWIYIQHGDICHDCNEESRKTGFHVAMNRLIRGRILDGRWVDQEVIWQADKETYASFTGRAAGGRICFDEKGHVYISVGNMGGAYHGIQDLSLPYGKIFRITVDGQIPKDNPFYNKQGALKSIWSYGFRSPQGLEFDRATGQLWGTEMGPMGGDEINLLLPGENYGWPLYSKGLLYDGSKVDMGKQLGIEWKLEDIQQPKVDMTPSPAISSFIFYRGDSFSKWENNLIAGTLKAKELYRFVVNGSEISHKEVLLSDLERIRDIEVGFDGFIYLLLEHSAESQIVRLVSP